MFTKRPKQAISRLRTAIALSRSSESLRDLPDRLANIITYYETASVNPEYRADVFAILNFAVVAAESMMDETYDAQDALTQVAAVMQVLPRVIIHLNDRPTSKGHSILNPTNNTIYPQVHSTEGEALQNLESLQAMGAAKHCLVVPVKVISQHAVQPRGRLPAPPSFDPEHIPPGIMPDRQHIPVRDWTPPPITDFHIEPPPTKSAGPNLSIPIDVQSETVSLPNSPAGEQKGGSATDHLAAPAPTTEQIPQHNNAPAPEPAPVPELTSETKVP